MSSDDNDDKKESPGGLWEKLTTDFREEGKGGVFEQMLNYAIDLFTVTAGAGT